MDTPVGPMEAVQGWVTPLEYPDYPKAWILIPLPSIPAMYHRAIRGQGVKFAWSVGPTTDHFTWGSEATNHCSQA